MSSGGRRRGGNPNFSSEDQALNMIAREAEARLAAKRASRAEARSIRMKELERQQKEADERMDKEYKLNLLVEDAPKKRVIQRAPEDAAASRNTDSYVKSLQDSLREVEENYKKAMVSNAQLDNEKQALSYQVDYLKDRLGDEEENVHNFQDELTQLNRIYNNLTRSNERTVDELERFKYALAERDKILEEYGINPDGTRNLEHEHQQQQPTSLPNGVDALPVDVIDAGSLDKASFKSQSSVSSTTTSEDRDLLLEQIKSLKDEVAELRRENDSEAFQLQDMAVDELRPDVGIEKRLTATNTVQTTDSCELERSTFVDVSDEAARAIDDIDQAPPDESPLVASGTVVNNNEKNDDFEVIDTTLNHPNAVSQFEDASYESSARFTESMDSAVLLSEVHDTDVTDTDVIDMDSMEANRNEESSSPMHLLPEDVESIVVTQSQPCYYSDFDIVDEDPNEKGQKMKQSSVKEKNQSIGKDVISIATKDDEAQVINADEENETRDEICKKDKVEQESEETERNDEIESCDVHTSDDAMDDVMSQGDGTPLDLSGSTLTQTELLADVDQPGVCLNNDDNCESAAEVQPPTNRLPVDDEKESADVCPTIVDSEESKDDVCEVKHSAGMALGINDDGDAEDIISSSQITDTSKTDGHTGEIEQSESQLTSPETEDSSAINAVMKAIVGSSPIREEIQVIEDMPIVKSEEQDDDNNIIELPAMKATNSTKDSTNKPIKILKAVKGEVASSVPLEDKSGDSKVVVVVDDSVTPKEDAEIKDRPVKAIGHPDQDQVDDATQLAPSVSSDVNWEISVERSPPPVPKERTKKKKKKKRRKSKDMLQTDVVKQPADPVPDAEEEKQTTEDRSLFENRPVNIAVDTADEPGPADEEAKTEEGSTVENRPVSIIVNTADEPCPADEETKTGEGSTVENRPVSIIVDTADEPFRADEETKSEEDTIAGEMVDTQSAASNSPVLLDVESRGASNSLSESSDIDCQDDDGTAGGSDNEAPRKRSKSKKGSKKDSKKESCKSQ